LHTGSHSAARIIQGHRKCKIFRKLEEKNLHNIEIFFFFFCTSCSHHPALLPHPTSILTKVLKMTPLSQVRNVVIFLLESVNYEIHIKYLKTF